MNLSAGRAGDKARLLLFLPASLGAALEGLARAASPREACAVLLGRRLPHGFLLRAVRASPNLHPQPCSAFELDPGLVVAADTEARRQGLQLLGFFHSHPDGPPVPSRADREAGWDGHLGLILGLDSERRFSTQAYRMARTGWPRLGIVRLRG